jgi:multidrug efflux pump subunit AcrB
MVFVMVLLFGLPVFLLPTKWENQTWYNETVGADYYQENVRPIVNKVLGGSLRLFYQDVYEASGYRNPERTRLYMNASLPYGHTLQQMDELIRPAEEYLATFPQIEKFVTNVYSGRRANIIIEFKPEHENGSFPYSLKNKLVQRSIDWGGVEWSVYGVGQGYSNKTYDAAPSFKVALKGYHYDKLSNWADTLAGKLLRHKRIVTVDTDAGQNWWRDIRMPQYVFRPKSDLPINYDMNTALASVRDRAISQFPALYLPYTDKLTPVYIEGARSIDFYSLQKSSYNSAPLAAFGDITLEQVSPAINKEDRQYLRTVAFDYNGSYNFGEKYLKQVLAEQITQLPPGFKAEILQMSFGNKEEQKKYELLLLLMVGVFFIGTIYSESFTFGLFLVLIIPLSFIGLFLIFGLFQFSFDQGGYAAFLLIGGLSVNALLYLHHEFVIQHRTHGRNAAIMEAIKIKSTPILLTIISTCVGLIPFLMNGDKEVFWFSFAIGTIGGMLFSTVVIFWFLPMLMWDGKELSNNV